MTGFSELLMLQYSYKVKLSSFCKFCIITSTKDSMSCPNA